MKCNWKGGIFILFQENEKGEVKCDWARAHQEGIELYLDGKQTSPDMIACMCLNEASEYMADYIYDKEGKVEEVRLNKISSK